MASQRVRQWYHRRGTNMLSPRRRDGLVDERELAAGSGLPGGAKMSLKMPIGGNGSLAWARALARVIPAWFRGPLRYTGLLCLQYTKNSAW